MFTEPSRIEPSPAESDRVEPKRTESNRDLGFVGALSPVGHIGLYIIAEELGNHYLICTGYKRRTESNRDSGLVSEVVR